MFVYPCINIHLQMSTFQMKILENKLFSIEPKKGKLEPGERCTVTLAYRHTMVGTDRLPVLLKLSYGREILVRMCLIKLLEVSGTVVAMFNSKRSIFGCALKVSRVMYIFIMVEKTVPRSWSSNREGTAMKLRRRPLDLSFR